MPLPCRSTHFGRCVRHSPTASRFPGRLLADSPDNSSPQFPADNPSGLAHTDSAYKDF